MFERMPMCYNRDRGARMKRSLQSRRGQIEIALKSA